MHILPPVTAEGFDGSHHPRFAECGRAVTSGNVQCRSKFNYLIRTIDLIRVCRMTKMTCKRHSRKTCNSALAAAVRLKCFEYSENHFSHKQLSMVTRYDVKGSLSVCTKGCHAYHMKDCTMFVSHCIFPYLCSILQRSRSFCLH